jgi:hemoglobin-like flavoprotein
VTAWKPQEEEHMTPEQQAIVRESWRRFEPTVQSDASFYERLFALDPAVRHLFASVDLERLQRKLMAMLAEIVRVLDQPDVLVSEVAALGSRHLHYGVRDADYQSVGAALLWTLEQNLGEEFTPEVRAAWTEAYLLVSTVMRRAAARAASST